MTGDGTRLGRELAALEEQDAGVAAAARKLERVTQEIPMEKLAEEIVDAVLEEFERSPEMDRTGLRRDRMVGRVAELIETSPRVRMRVRRGVADGAGL